MNLRLLGISGLMLVFCATAGSQDVKHAPTFEACTADLNLWTSQIPGWPNPNLDQVREGTKNLAMSEMDRRLDSLGECSGAYPAFLKSKSNEIPAMLALIQVYHAERAERMLDFLSRHNLLLKFIEEDEAGKR
jgi:hypothetical protein